jgi:hypothetical protein
MILDGAVKRDLPWYRNNPPLLPFETLRWAGFQAGGPGANHARQDPMMNHAAASKPFEEFDFEPCAFIRRSVRVLCPVSPQPALHR